MLIIFARLNFIIFQTQRSNNSIVQNTRDEEFHIPGLIYNFRKSLKINHNVDKRIKLNNSMSSNRINMFKSQPGFKYFVTTKHDKNKNVKAWQIIVKNEFQ